MKKILLATTMLVGTAGFAAAEVTVSGSGYMGVGNFFAFDPDEEISENDDIEFRSRVRIQFTASGETDSGLSFGASIRADNAADGNVGEAGSVFVSGAFGKLSMGDVDGAATALVGHVAGVGYTGLSDFNESTYIGGGTKESALYEYSAGAFTVAASVGQPADYLNEGNDTYAVAAKYTIDAYSIALGYESADEVGAATDVDHIIVGVSAAFSGLTLKANYGSAEGTGLDGDQWAVSASYSANGLGVTAFMTDDSELGGVEAYGLGASYDLGGGAAVAGGYVKNETEDTDGFDLGVTFSF